MQAKKNAEDALNKNEELTRVKFELESGKEALDKQVTELNYRNKELLELNELVAHDLQEPVRKISLYTDRLMRDQAYSEAAIKLFSIVIKSSQRLQDVLKNLQEYLYISSSEIVKESLDLNVLLQTTLSRLEKPYANVDFTITSETLPTIKADAKQLQILFYQILKNCFKFRMPNRKLHITVTAALVEQNMYFSTENKYKYTDFVTIRIEDNGRGFNMLYKDLIFKILKKLDLKSEGLGFGLALCKRIVENHLGNIAGTAEEHKGARFTVMLPLQ